MTSHFKAISPEPRPSDKKKAPTPSRTIELAIQGVSLKAHLLWRLRCSLLAFAHLDPYRHSRIGSLATLPGQPERRLVGPPQKIWERPPSFAKLKAFWGEEENVSIRIDVVFISSRQL
ncbi:MAG: hypothetical protein EA369_01535 [Bradymonadales bacterium]|nr:MAG: hypothetical protein EA369_01535 [Bradymonadales bacterium]